MLPSANDTSVLNNGGETATGVRTQDTDHVLLEAEDLKKWQPKKKPSAPENDPTTTATGTDIPLFQTAQDAEPIVLALANPTELPNTTTDTPPSGLLESTPVTTPSPSTPAATSTTSATQTVITSWKEAAMGIDKIPPTTLLLNVVGVSAGVLLCNTASTTTTIDTKDNQAPSIQIASNKTSLKAGETATLTFTLSETSTDFTVNNITVTGGKLSNFSGDSSGKIYTATFTPNPDSATTATASVLSGKFHDAAGNPNSSSSTTNLLVDTLIPVAPLATLNEDYWTVNPQVTMSIDVGNGQTQDVVIEVYPNQAPITTTNWLTYVTDNFYKNLVFHRIVAGFMVQGGGFDSSLQKKTATYSAIALEDTQTTELSNLIGTIAMARTSDPNSATSEFFINVVNNGFLDYTNSNPGYAVFGEVVNGMDVIQIISTTSTHLNTANEKSAPDSPITMTQVKISTAGTVFSNDSSINLKGLESGAHWEYRIDSGTWVQSTSSQINLGTSTNTQSVQIKQVDNSGNSSPVLNWVHYTSATESTIAQQSSLIDLATASDTSDSGSNSDNITRNSTLELSAILTNMASKTVWLMDNGKHVANATANSSGILEWHNVPATAGNHLYTLYDPEQHTRIVPDTSLVTQSELLVRVI